MYDATLESAGGNPICRIKSTKLHVIQTVSFGGMWRIYNNGYI